MKNLFICSNLLFLLISCSADSDDDVFINNESLISKIDDSLSPENKANPLDYKGRHCYNALVKFQQQNQFPIAIDDITEQVNFIATQFEIVNSYNAVKITFTDEMIQLLMEDPENTVVKIVQKSELSSVAKISLITFLKNLISQRDLEFTVIYNFIVKYEDAVLQSDTMNNGDLDVILTITSISRYLIYAEYKHKDRDWEKLVGNGISKTFFSNNETSIITIITMLETIL